MKFKDLEVNDFFIKISEDDTHKLYFKKSKDEMIDLTAPNMFVFSAKPNLWVKPIHLYVALTDAVLKNLPR